MSDPILARQAYELRLSGDDDFDIAEKLSITVDEATSLVSEYGDAIPSVSNTEARRDEVRRVDVWLGRVNQEYLEKTLPIEKAVTSFCKLADRRAKLLGLDTPSRQEITALLQASPTSVDAEIASLVLELGIQDFSTRELDH